MTRMVRSWTPCQPRSDTNKDYKGQQNKQTASSKDGRVKFICCKCTRYGEDTLDCGNKKNCTWSGN